MTTSLPIPPPPVAFSAPVETPNSTTRPTRAVFQPVGQHAPLGICTAEHAQRNARILVRDLMRPANARGARI